MSGQVGRPPLEGEVIHLHIHFRFRRGEDDDLLLFIESIPLGLRAAMIKAALRRGGMRTAAVVDRLPEDELADALDDMLL